MKEATGSQELAESAEFGEAEPMRGGNGTRGKAAQWLLPSPRAGQPFGMRREFWPLLLGLAYIAVNAWLGGLNNDHVFIGSLALLDLYNLKSRKFLRRFMPFILAGVLFDSMRYYYWDLIDGRVNVREPYFRDLEWFGVPLDIAGSVKKVTPNEFFQLYPNMAFDLLCGLAYLVFVAEYLAVAFYLFFRDQARWLLTFGWCFFSVNLLGYLTYFIYPAAPPWYVTRFGFAPATQDIKPFAAGAGRFDQILGTELFDEVYGRGVNAFGAYPSLHVAYPLLVVWICFSRDDLKWARAPASLFHGLMCLSAVYLNHHYVVDVMLGSLYAIVVAFVASILLRRPVAGEQAPAV